MNAFADKEQIRQKTHLFKLLHNGNLNHFQMPAEGEVTHMACVQEASLQFSVLNFFSSEDISGVSAAGCGVAAACLAVLGRGERHGSCPGELTI